MLVACCDQNFGKLDVALLEDELAAFVGDDGRAQLPVDLVERIDAVLGEVPLELEPGHRPPAGQTSDRRLGHRLRLVSRCMPASRISYTAALSPRSRCAGCR